jgi:hypothetical protein
VDAQSVLTSGQINTAFSALLALIGAGFLLANAHIVLDYLRYRRRRIGALITWRQRNKPLNYWTTVGIGVVLGLLVVYKLVGLRQPPYRVFGESMMFLYYACLTPLSRAIGRGFYEEGIWADSSFIPYTEVGGISWREGEHDATLVVISRLRSLARRLVVPLEHYSAARRLLRDRIARHDIQFAGTGLDLGGRDEREGI